MIGFRICTRTRQVSSDWFARFATLPVANISDVMSRMSAGGASLRPYYTGERMVGVALTVRTRPGDNLMIHKALDMAGPGDVVVVDAGGDLTNALIGELMVGYAKQRGLAGIIIHGAIRDSAELLAGNFPVFAGGVTHRGPYKDGPGEINVPVSLGGMIVEPGDLVCGDADGVLSVPFDHIENIYQTASSKHADEERQMIKINAGESDRSWVDVALHQRGCAFDQPAA